MSQGLVNLKWRTKTGKPRPKMYKYLINIEQSLKNSGELNENS